MGGNIFENTSRIPLARVNTTIAAYTQELGRIFPMKAWSLTFLRPVGSTGKTPSSGDIDLAIDRTHLVRSFSKSEIKKWGLEYEEWLTAFHKIEKRARTATTEMCKVRALLTLIAKKLCDNGVQVDLKKVGPGTMFTLFQQHDEHGPTEQSVQIDWVVGNIDWLEWAYYSHGESGLKGLHRTQFMIACLSAKNHTFSHAHGIKEKKTSIWTVDTVEDALELFSELYDSMHIEDTFSFESLHYWLKTSSTEEEYEEVIKIYKGILKISKDIVPKILQ